MKRLLRYITLDTKGIVIWSTIFMILGTLSGVVVGILFWNSDNTLLQNLLPIVTTPIGFSCVYLLGVRKNSGNAMGFLSNISEGVVNFIYGNFGLFISVIYYGVSHIIGLFDWNKNKQEDGRVDVKNIENRRDWVTMILGLVVSSVIVLLMYLTDGLGFEINSFAAIANIAVMYLGILAQGLMILRYKFAWWLWVALNVIAIPLNFVTGNLVFGVMYIFYMVNALITIYYQYVILPEEEAKEVLETENSNV